MKVLIQQKVDSELKEYHVSVELAEALSTLLNNIVKNEGGSDVPKTTEHRRVDALFPDWSRKAGNAVRQETAAEMAIQEDEKRRLGFVITHCDVCGDRYAWNAKKPVYSFTCKNCNQRIAFNSPRPAFFSCPKCNRSWRYHTNYKGDKIEARCLHCGSEMVSYWNPKRKVYGTLPESLQGGLE